MLSNHTIEVIKSTVPVLEVHGTAITKRFYQRLFENNPDLLNIFNHANQSQGRQQNALANAVLAAAKYIDQLETILPVVKQISHKHRSLGILPEHYPIVGENLLAAIKEVLGDAATDEIIGAWAEAYGVIADVFISIEAEMYAQTEQQRGGWEGFRPFKVDKKVKESDVITSFYLVPVDGGDIPTFEAGQYVSVKIDNIPAEKNTHIRQYSLSNAPGKPYYRITVKREEACEEKPAGKVSIYLHEQVNEGDELMLSAPAGEFTLNVADERPVVFISGGVGLTPLVSMFSSLTTTDPNRKVSFIHASRNGEVHALRNEIELIASKSANASVHWCYEKPTAHDKQTEAYTHEGYIDLAWLEQIVATKDAHFYFCGPVPFMSKVNSLLEQWGVAPEDIHYEFFGPAGSL